MTWLRLVGARLIFSEVEATAIQRRSHETPLRPRKVVCLLFSCETGRILAMSTKAQAILEEIRALPPEEQSELYREMSQLQARRRAWEEQKARLRQIQAECAGKGYLAQLLSERAKERARERDHE